MSVFNPQVQETNPGEYLRISHPIDTPEFKSGAAIALKGFGNVIEETAKGVNAYIEDKAKTETRNTLEPVRDQYTRDLETANRLSKYAANVAPTTESQTGGVAGSMLPDLSTDILASSPSAKLPADIQKATQSIVTLQGALNSGKLSETDFKGRTAAILKDIRSSYPQAYRDKIDAEASSVLGFNPANAYVQGLISDYNKNLANVNDERNHMLSVARSKGLQYDGGAKAYDNLLTGKWTPSQFAGWLSPLEARHTNLVQADLELTNASKNREDVKARADIAANAHSEAAIQDIVHTTTYFAGIQSTASMREMIVDAYTGKRPISQEQADGMANLAIGYKQQYINKMREKLSPLVSSGALSQEKMNATIQNGSQVFTELEHAFRDKEKGTGLAFSLIQNIKAREGDTQYTFVNSTAGQAALDLRAFHDTVGPKAAEQIALQDSYAKLRGGFQTFTNRARLDIATDLRADKQYQTWKSAVDDLLSPNKQKHPDARELTPVSMNSLVSLVDNTMLDPNTPEQTRTAIFANTFSPANHKALVNIQGDYLDDKGRTISGKHGIATRLISPDIINFAKTQKGTQAFANYKDWADTTIEMDLLKPDIMRLTDYQTTVANTPLGKPQFTWDANTHELGFKVEGDLVPNRMRMRFNVYDRQMREMVGNLNKSFAMSAKLAEAVGEDPDTYVMQRFVSALQGGVSPERFDLTKVQGIPQKIIDAIVVSRAKEQKLEEDKKKYRQ